MLRIQSRRLAGPQPTLRDPPAPGRLPNFLLIGAAKAGTTSLARYLGQHPEVFVSPWKEPNYFAFAGEALPTRGPASAEVLQALLYFHSVTDFAQYQALFRGAVSAKAVGEASVRYFYYPKAPRRIHATIPDVRLVVILRDPVSRLYSHHCMNLQYQLEPLGLREALAAEPARIRAGWGWDWHYVAVSRYAAQLRRYFELFDRQQIQVILYDDWAAHPLPTFQSICRHIGVSDGFTPDTSEREKVARRPRLLALDRWLHWPSTTRRVIERALPRPLWRPIAAQLSRWNSRPVPPLDDALRAELAPLFRDDIAELESLLARPIPWMR
jgi:hypothetical protein